MSSELVSLREFARRKGWNPGYAHKLKEQGRLVLAGGKVDVAASELRLAESADPSREHLRRAAAPAPAPAAYEPPAPPAAAPITQNATFNKARTASVVFDAKLKELEFKKASGLLVDRDEVARLRFTEFRLLRDALGNVGARVKDALVADLERALEAGGVEADLRSATLRALGESLRAAQIVEDEMAVALDAFASDVLSRAVTADGDDNDAD